MASIFESSKVFEQRVKAIGLEPLWPKFVKLGWTKFSILAFASDYIPGTSDATVFTSEVLKPVAGEDADNILRYKGESMPDYIVREDEAYTELKDSLQRVRQDRNTRDGIEETEPGEKEEAAPPETVEVGYFDTVSAGDNEPGFDGSWSNYPYFESGVIVVTSMKEGLFVLKRREGRPVS